MQSIAYNIILQQDNPSCQKFLHFSITIVIYIIIFQK